MVIPPKAFKVRVFGQHRDTNYNVSRVLPSAVVSARIAHDFQLTDGSPDSLEVGTHNLVVAIITNNSAITSVSVRLDVQCSDASLLSLNMSNASFELNDRITTAVVQLRAAFALSADAVVWAEASVIEVRGLGSVAKRLYIIVKHRPDPPLTTRRQTTRRVTRRVASTTARTTTTVTSTAPKSIRRISRQQTTPFPINKPVNEPKCTSLSSSYTTHCLQSNISTIAHCTAFRWIAQFVLEEGSLLLTSVQLTSSALPLIDTNEAKARLDVDGRASVNTSVSRRALNATRTSERILLLVGVAYLSFGRIWLRHQMRIRAQSYAPNNSLYNVCSTELCM